MRGKGERDSVPLSEMSANQRILLASLAAMALIVGFLRLTDDDTSTSAAAPSTVTSPSTPPSSESVPPIATPAPISAPAPTVAPAPSVTTAAPVTTQVTATNPPTTAAAAASRADSHCPDTNHGAVIDRQRQRAWLCDNGVSTGEFPITTAITQPKPGTYPVYAKDLNASSNFGGHYSTMTHFVAFTKGIYTGARIAFHSVPKLTNGTFVQPVSSLGTADRFGDSSGCIRVSPDQAVKIWNWLGRGDKVVVIS